MKKVFHNFFSKLREKRKIVISNPTTFQEGFAVNLSRAGYLLLLVLTILLIAVITYFTIAYTSLKQYIPGYPDIENADKIYETDIENMANLDAIAQQNNNRELWINNLRNILANNDSVLMKDVAKLIEKDSNTYKNIVFERNLTDSMLRIKVATQEAKFEQNKLRGIVYKQNFTEPVEGNLTQNGNVFTYTTDSNATVSAAMKGVLIAKNNRSLILQHSDNLLSVYKNCINTTGEIGETIPRGKELGEVKDTALIFEVWHKGKAINLKKIIE